MSVLSTVARHEYYIELGSSLPPPVTATLADRQRRLTTAIETFEALRPGDAYEARLAVRIVLTGAHAAECLREAGVYHDDYPKRTRCRAQSASLMREENAAKRMLAQEQKVRLATEAVANTATAQPAAAQPAAASAPPPQADPHTPPPVLTAAASPQPAPVPPAVAPSRPATTRAASPQVPAASAPPPSPEAIAQAEAFAEQDIEAAAQIRHDRGVTPQSTVYFRHLTLPTDPAVIDALVRGTSDLLTLLDDAGGETLDAAA